MASSSCPIEKCNINTVYITFFYWTEAQCQGYIQCLNDYSLNDQMASSFCPIEKCNINTVHITYRTVEPKNRRTSEPNNHSSAVLWFYSSVVLLSLYPTIADSIYIYLYIYYLHLSGGSEVLRFFGSTVL